MVNDHYEKKCEICGNLNEKDLINHFHVVFYPGTEYAENHIQWFCKWCTEILRQHIDKISVQKQRERLEEEKPFPLKIKFTAEITPKDAIEKLYELVDAALNDILKQINKPKEA